MAAAPADRSPARGRALLALVLAVGSPLVLSLAPLGTSDLWFHLAAGRWMAAHHAVPHVDVFSFTVAGQPWAAHEWLWEVLAWHLWQAGGAAAIVGLRLASSWLALGAAWCAACIEGAGLEAATVATAVLSLAAARRIMDRPQLLTAAAFAGLLLLLERHRRGQRRVLRVALLPLFLIWANAHAGVIYGLVLIGYELAWAGIERDLRRARELGVMLLVALAVAALATPLGLDVLRYPFHLLRENQHLDIAELRSLGFFARAPSFAPALIALAVALIASLAELRRRPRIAVRTLTLLGATVWHVRGIDLAALSAIPVVAAWLERVGAVRTWGRASLGLSAVLALELFWLAADPTVRPGRGIGHVPQAALDFLHRRHVEGHGYNSYELGGYLLFAAPDRPVFVDGRTDAYYPLLDYLDTGADPFTRWPMSYAVLLHADSGLPTVREHLLPAWFDDDDEVDVTGRPDLELRCLLPEGPFFATGVPGDVCQSEARRMAQESALSWRANLLVSAAFLAAGQADPAQAALDQASQADDAPSKDELKHLRALALALAEPEAQRAGDLHVLARIWPDPGVVALDKLAAGDCSAWRPLVATHPVLRAWIADARSPVHELVQRACGAAGGE